MSVSQEHCTGCGVEVVAPWREVTTRGAESALCDQCHGDRLLELAEFARLRAIEAAAKAYVEACEAVPRGEDIASTYEALRRALGGGR